MKIATYSDLHLEFGYSFKLPDDLDADVLVLAGDICTFNDISPLEEIFRQWEKPIIYIPGNHEYYGVKNGVYREQDSLLWVRIGAYPHVVFSPDEFGATEIDGVFFCFGTMWTDFNKSDPKAMLTARFRMMDYAHIFSRTSNDELIRPEEVLGFHDRFMEELGQWLRDPRDPDETALKPPKKAPKKVVVSHHAPVVHPNTRHPGSELSPAFVATDCLPLIEEHQPDLWIYGHTHQCDDQKIGKTRIISNQRGYQFHESGFECECDFDPNGKVVEI